MRIRAGLSFCHLPLVGRREYEKVFVAIALTVSNREVFVASSPKKKTRRNGFFWFKQKENSVDFPGD